VLKKKKPNPKPRKCALTKNSPGVAKFVSNLACLALIHPQSGLNAKSARKIRNVHMGA